MKKKSLVTPQALSRYLPQFFVGLFFLSAGYIKAAEGFFGEYRSTLGSIFQYWMSSNLTPAFYEPFMTFMTPYGDALAVVIIALQCVAGILLILNRYTRVAGVLLIFLQLNVYLATYYHLELRVLNSQAMLLGLYFFARGEMKGKVWTVFTYGLVAVGLMHVAGRALNFQDYTVASFAWQRAHYAEYVMSSWPGIKYFVLWATAGTFGPVLWASFWWVKVGLLLGLLTRYRLQAGIAFLILSLLITLAWLNVWSCEGVFWVLTMFVWVTHEHFLQKSSKNPPQSFLP